MTSLRPVFSFLLLSAFHLAAWAREVDVILAFRDVQFFKVQEISPSPLTMRLSGLAFHSALAVGNVAAVQSGNSLQVLVHLTQTAPGLSGNFSYDLVVPESIDTVSFGIEKSIVWRRDTGFLQP
jgi:hypothetical protein